MSSSGVASVVILDSPEQVGINRLKLSGLMGVSELEEPEIVRKDRVWRLFHLWGCPLD